ncbi:GDCCVxC domain-containing (seleno)protein [Marinobacter sp. OP 3.4]|uniref:GDCCVxC domain-containing (seleno)protein n=1 Tax=Marinobacter sp. OP 3.4 TaxID=3076501 RepID=UPI002E212245
MGAVITTSIITCPVCGHRSPETMPPNACQISFECPHCGEILRPKPGDCCVFCSWGSENCPPVQQGLGSCDRPSSNPQS